ncbi:SsrA-binding protein [bacterium]|nr:SsrA-binding protein [bacterium]
MQNTIISLQGKELFLLGMDVPLYEKTSPVLVSHYFAKQKRKLLVTKRELTRIAANFDKP